MDAITNKSLFDFSDYFAKDLFEGTTYPWEVIPKIKDFIVPFAKTLDFKDYFVVVSADKKYDVWVSKDAKIADDAHLHGPLIVGPGTEIRHGAFIRGNVIIGKNCVIGNSTEIKNSVILDNVQLPHYNYVGDSIVGNYSHLGAGAIISNLKNTKNEVYINKTIPTGLRKVGAFIGDNVDVGCNAVLNPGTVIGKGSIIYSGITLRGIVEPETIVKPVINNEYIFERRKP